MFVDEITSPNIDSVDDIDGQDKNTITFKTNN